MPNGLITSMGMSEEDRFKYRERAQQGDFYQIKGAFGVVFIPKYLLNGVARSGHPVDEVYV